MKSNPAFSPGIETLLREHADWLAGQKVGLVAHPASADWNGVHSAELLRKAGVNLVCLFGPEHGFSGRGGAGETVPDGRHPEWGLPVCSLYGDTRKPTPEMLRDLDVIVFDLQDIAARPYTYVSTLRYVLEAAAENGKAVIVADRPIPLPNAVDGPLLDPAFESFVGAVRTPVAYGMTPGETARWLKDDLALDLDLRVAPLRGFTRRPASRASRGWEPWIPPSPAICNWACAVCFPATVFFEALPAVDHGRGTDAAFQVIGAPWLDALALTDELDKHPLPGVQIESCDYHAESGAHKGRRVQGIRMEILDADLFNPVRTGVTILAALQSLYGADALWSAPGTRPDFFDQLMGADSVRRALLAGTSPEDIAAEWEQSYPPFLEKRRAALLYG